MNVVRSNPNNMTGLIIEVAHIFKSLSTDGLVYAVRDVADVPEAVRLLDICITHLSTQRSNN